MPSSAKKQVIGYGRVSTEEQASNYSLDAQKARFETLCRQNGWHSLGFETETASGTSVVGRPIFCRILERVQNGGVDGLWVKETDRLCRPENLGDLSLISDTLASQQTELIVDSRVFDLAEDNSVLMLDFEGIMAKHFRRQLLRNMNRGKVRKAEMGRKAGGADVFGYQTNENGEYRPNPKQAKTVKLIFRLAMQGLSLQRISRELQTRSIRTKRGLTGWSRSVLVGILRNDMYIGVYRFQKERKAKDVDGTNFRTKQLKSIVVGSAEEPNHPPVIEKWVFDAVQQKLNANRTRNSLRLFMATGLLRCTACNERMVVKYSTGPGGAMVPKYVCRAKPNCSSPRISAEESNQTLWKALVGLFTKPERVYSLLTDNDKTFRETIKEQIRDLESEKKTILDKQDRLLNLYLEQKLQEATYESKNGELGKQLTAVRGQLTELRRRKEELGQRELATELVHTLRILSRSHRRFTEDQKIRVFRSLVSEAHILEDRVSLELYVQPIENIWWKYRHKSRSKKPGTSSGQTVAVSIKQRRPETSEFTTTQAAQILGLTPDLLRSRIKTGKYPDVPRRKSARRIFTVRHIQKLRAIG